MRAIHEQLLDTVMQERERSATRRAFLRGGAKLAGGGALALAAAASPLAGGLRVTAAQDFAGPIDVLNYALTLEHLEASFYRDGLRSLGDSAFSGNVYERLILVRDHEIDHVDALVATINSLGGTPVSEAMYDFGGAYDDAGVFLATAQALENTGTGAYTGAAQFLIDNDALLTAALTIHGVEARHAAYLNRLNGDSPFPDAFETALTPAEVLNIAGPFIVTDMPATGTGSSL